MPAPNPEAIAWYVQRSEDLLDELRERARSVRSRGGQLAGFCGAVLALAGANAEAVLGALHGPARTSAGVMLLLGVSLLVASLVTAIHGTLLPRMVSNVSATEVSNYTSARFIHEPELWRVQVRTLRTAIDAIELNVRQGDEAALAVRRAEYLFLSGLFSVGSLSVP